MLRLSPSFASLTLLALLSACRSPSDTPHTDSKENPVSPSSETPEAPTEESEEPAQATAELAPQTQEEPAEQVPPRDVPRVYGKSRHVWIRSGPTTATQWIGFLWWGGSVARREEAPRSGPGCGGQWIAVEPRGWVCVDGERATLDPEDPTLLAIYPYRPQVESAWPHRYAAVHQPTRSYEQPPSEAQQRAREDNFLDYLEKLRQAREDDRLRRNFGRLDPSLVGRPAPQLPPLPKGLSESRTRIAPRSAFAYSEAFDQEERAFLLAGDLSWVPRDRVELLDPVTFQGLPLGEQARLPLAFFRGKKRPGFIRQADGSFQATEPRFDRLSHTFLTGEMEEWEKTRYYKVRGEELWVSHREAVVLTGTGKTPWGAPIGEEDTTGLAPAGRATWIEVSILGGWLLAYEGTRPVYATLISAGRGGTPHKGRDPLETASTPTGRFSITGKFKTATMESSSTPIIHSDVPWTLNFSGPHALHTAYWHNDWGELKSAGCVNLSPLDGQWIFHFSEPEVPEGWHGVRHVSRYGDATRLIIHE